MLKNVKNFCGWGFFRNFAASATEGATASSFVFYNKPMIDKSLIEQIVADGLKDTDMFPVEISVSPDNRIVVEVDSMTAVDIDSCVALNRAIEQALDRDKEDFELEVGSAGLTSPFKVKQQFDKNIGNEVEVLTRDGLKFTGTLVETTEEGFTVEVARKVKHEGAKRPVIEMQPETLAYGDAKTVKYVINFK